MSDAAKPKFTQGPWQSYETEHHIGIRANGARVAYMSIAPNSSLCEEGRANARLIAAAPDLYRAVEGLCAALDRAMDYIGNGYQPQDIVEEAREARDQAERFIAKARGED